MRIAVHILSTNTEPSSTNIKAMKDTFVAYSLSGTLIHDYDFFFYYGDHSYNHVYQQAENIYRINTNLKESIYNTFEKGIYTLKSTPGYDWYIRINISCFLNIKLLDKIIDQLNEDTVYCNAINSYINDENLYNDLYARGDFMIFSAKTREGILHNSGKYIRCDEISENRINVPHVDDTLFGLCIKDYFGPDYYKHLQSLKYNYIPYPSSEIRNFNPLAVSSRVKTNPPGVNYSGYSWADNEYRRFDAQKMYSISHLLKLTEYPETVKLEDLYDNSRPTLFVQISNQAVDNIKRYLDMKYKT